MADRAIWSGNISFGLVSIPVKLHSATRSEDVSFRQVHVTCGTPIQQKRWCPTDDEEVPWDEIARGYEYGKGRFVLLTDEDFESLPVPSRHTIDIRAFVPGDEIDPVYYEKAYQLLPAERGEKPYALLMRAIADKDLVAIASITIRKKEQLCALRPRAGSLVLETLFYPDEIRIDEDAGISGTKVSAEELKLAHQLIGMLRKPFEPADYKDTYREAVLALIEAKREGKEVVAAPEQKEAGIIDLREALARSLDRSRGGKKTRKTAGTRRKSARGSTRKAG
ncbi:MAG TPA: Ku protein [Gemmatimonadaceae bacterium]|nr:Ku protein [Gemmatimonadaceae bacterium]